MPSCPPRFVLGFDAGGSATRWALAAADGTIAAEGEAAPASGLQMLSADGRAALADALRSLAAALPAQPRAAAAGITGLDEAQASAFAALLARALGIDTAAVLAGSDIELLCRSAFADAPPGSGIVLYAGTGSVAALRDAAGRLQRAGGRGHLIDDAGSGPWIARQALARVWRAEDECPGAWRDSPLARRLFERIGGSDWAATRRFVYGAAAAAREASGASSAQDARDAPHLPDARDLPGVRDAHDAQDPPRAQQRQHSVHSPRGALGPLALAVAQAADEDAAALSLLEEAGRELARLVYALRRRCGAQPVVRAGRVFDLHAAIGAALRAALPADTPLRALGMPPHHALARLALRTLRP